MGWWWAGAGQEFPPITVVLHILGWPGQCTHTGHWSPVHCSLQGRTHLLVAMVMVMQAAVVTLQQ